MYSERTAGSPNIVHNNFVNCAAETRLLPNRPDPFVIFSEFVATPSRFKLRSATSVPSSLRPGRPTRSAARTLSSISATKLSLCLPSAPSMVESGGDSCAARSGAPPSVGARRTRRGT
jgi:hypothetical protein